MKRDIAKLVTISLIVLLLNIKAVSAEESILLPPDMGAIFARDTIVLGVYSQERPPFFMENAQGELYGLDINLAEGIAEELGVALEINREAESYDELFEMLARKEFDLVISKFSKTFARVQSIKYTTPYVTFRWSIMLNSAYATQAKIVEYPMDHLREAEDIKIGVMGDTSWETFAEELFVNAEIIGFDEWQDVLDALSRGEIIATLYDENEIIKSIYQDPDIALYSSVYILEDKKDFIAIAVPADSSQLLFWLNYYLEKNKISFTVDDLMEKYPEIYE